MVMAIASSNCIENIRMRFTNAENVAQDFSETRENFRDLAGKYVQKENSIQCEIKM